MIFELFKKWRDAREKKASRQAQYERLFESFLIETQPLVPKAPKHPKAALYRHAWKRSVVLEVLYQRASDQSRAALFIEFQKIAAERYYLVAPEGPYGKIPLKMESKAGELILKAEIQRLSPPKRKQLARPLSCIYIGKCEKGLIYVGQTLREPERRWIQHRSEGTGPFKKGVPYVSWEVVEGPIAPTDLDARESYFIGFHNSYENGYNNTRGNDLSAYEQGQTDRQRKLSHIK